MDRTEHGRTQLKSDARSSDPSSVHDGSATPGSVCSVDATRTIPLEVLEYMIDALHSSGHTPHRLDHCKGVFERRLVDNTLCNFALTCRALLPRSQALLCCCIHIGEEFDGGEERDHCVRPSEDLRCLAFALSTYPHLAPLVRTITAYDGLDECGRREDPVANTLPIMLACARLPNLKAVRLVSGFWQADLKGDVVVASPVFLGALSRFPGLGHLELSDIMLENFASLRRILAVLPSLTSLSLLFVQFRTGWSSPHLTTVPGRSEFPRITRLKLHLPQSEERTSSCWPYVLLDHLGPSLEQMILAIRYPLSITRTDLSDPPSMRVAFPRLTDVTVRILEGGAIAALSFLRDATGLAKLRNITIDVGAKWGVPRGSTYEESLIERAILDQSVLPCLERVTIAQLVGEVRSLEPLGESVRQWEAHMWMLLENSRRRFPRLHEKGFLTVVLAVRQERGYISGYDMRIWSMSPQGGVSSSDVIGTRFGDATLGALISDLYWLP